MGWNDRISSDALQRRKESNEIIDWWNEFFPYGDIYQCYFGTDRIFHETNHGSRIGNHIIVPGLCLCQNRYGILSV